MRAIAIAAAAGLIAGVLLARCSTPAPEGLPPAVQATVTRHQASVVVDSAAVRRLEGEKVEARRRELAAAAARQRSEDAAAVHRRRADYLEAIAIAAQTSADSAAAWQQAYYQRTGEAEDLRLALGDAALELKEAKASTSLAEAETAVWRSRSLRADTVIAELLPLAETAGDRCRLLGVISCPSRKQTAIAVVVATIAFGRLAERR